MFGFSMRWIPLLLTAAVACSTTKPVATPAAPLASPPTEASGRTQVVIVGGGIAGLVAATELERRGISVQLLEMSNRWGGRIVTAHYGPGLAAEYGMQEIWSKSPLAKIAKDLGLTLEGEEAFSSMVLDDKLYPFRQDTADHYLRSIFNAAEYKAWAQWKKRAQTLWTELHTAGMTPRLAPLNDISFLSWLTEEKLPPKVRGFLKATLECELGTDADSFSALSGLAEMRVYLFDQEDALHVRGGNSVLIRALAEKVRGPKLLNARVTHVQRTKDAQGRDISTVSFLKDEHRHQVQADRVILAVPWLNLHQIQMDPPLPPEAWDSLMTIGRGQYVVVHFLVDKKVHSLWGGVTENPFPVLTTGPLGVIYGITEPSPPEQPQEVFTLLIYGTSAREFHMVPQEAKRREILEGLDKLWPTFSSFVREANVYTYHPAAIPFWPPGRSPFDDRAKLLFRPFNGIHLAGDYLVSSHSEGAVVAGQTQAATIASELSR